MLIPGTLLKQIRRLLGFQTENETTVLSLEDHTRRERIEDLKSMMGSMDLEIDLPKSRRRLNKLH